MSIKSPAHARWAVAAIFFRHCFVVGAWVPHIPLVKERLAVGPGVFGLALLAFVAVTMLGYSGFLAGPPVIGFSAELVTLLWALGLTVIASLITALFARMVDAADTF